MGLINTQIARPMAPSPQGAPQNRPQPAMSQARAMPAPQPMAFGGPARPPAPALMQKPPMGAKGRPRAKSSANPAIVEKVVLASMNVLYNKGAIEHAVGMIKVAKPPSKAMAEIAFSLLKSIFQRAKGQLQPQAFTVAAKQVLMMLVKSCQKAGVQVSGKDIAQALTLMTKQAMTQSNLPTQKLDAAVATMDFNAAGKKIDAQMAQGA